jgi:hypothetical protein
MYSSHYDIRVSNSSAFIGILMPFVWTAAMTERRWNRESGIGNRESGIGNRESGIGYRVSGIGNRESERA